MAWCAPRDGARDHLRTSETGLEAAAVVRRVPPTPARRHGMNEPEPKRQDVHPDDAATQPETVKDGVCTAGKPAPNHAAAGAGTCPDPGAPANGAPTPTAPGRP